MTPTTAPDDLRTRIACAICRVVSNPCGECLESADDVIEELKLRIQVAGPDGIVGTGNYRYVTDWNTK